MKVYLAARYEQREEMSEIAQELRWCGFRSCASWLYGLKGDETSYLAQRNLDDIENSDFLVLFTTQLKAEDGFTSGGAYVEVGYALHAGKSVIVVGPLINIFTHLDRIRWFLTTKDFLAWARWGIHAFSGRKDLAEVEGEGSGIDNTGLETPVCRDPLGPKVFTPPNWHSGASDYAPHSEVWSLEYQESTPG
jgi:hypothetical protein